MREGGPGGRRGPLGKKAQCEAPNPRREASGGVAAMLTVMSEPIPADPGEVATLQTQLTALGYLVDDPAGIYGPSTTACVRQFQHHRGLLTDGIYGPHTHHELQRVVTMVNDPPLPHHL